MQKLTNSAIPLFLLLGFILISISCGEKVPAEITVMLPGDVAMELVRIPAGSFMMGSPETEVGHEPDEVPVHDATIGYDFYMGKTELTQAQWLAVMGGWPDDSHIPNEEFGVGDNYPAYYVSWNDCQFFFRALNEHIANTNQGSATFRLPSEAEWEYGCRAGTQTRFFWGDSVEVEDGYGATDYMWYEGNSDTPGTKPVGTKLPNPWGLYDMSGNVWEWCQDWYHDSYEGAPDDGSAWVDPPGIYRILHGGDWDNEAKTCRSANRNDHRKPDERSADLGFRVVRTAVN